MGPVELNLADLYLDLKSPRCAGARNQREALQKVLDDQQERIVVLAERLVDEGVVSTERLLVIRGVNGRDGFAVLDGNRMLTVLKILANPNLVDGLAVRESIRRALKLIAKKFDRSSLEPLSCLEVEDRKAGKTWVQLRRMNENGGKDPLVSAGAVAALHRTTQGKKRAASNNLIYFTPLRYPGGKGKLAPYIKQLIEVNDLLDGEYVEPYAGGAAIALELLLQGYVSRIHINDISRPVFAFWSAVPRRMRS
jgi:hypothetical protein